MPLLEDIATTMQFSTISKATFLETRVILANDNDAFFNDKCAFCWGEYDKDHQAARILPCNHVFGLDCLQEVVDAPNGDICVICRTQLFRPSIGVLLQRCTEFFVQRATGYLLLIYYQAAAYYAAWPDRVQILLWVLYIRLSGQTTFRCMSKIFTLLTDLDTRFPGFDLFRQLRLLNSLHSLAFGILHIAWLLSGTPERTPIESEAKEDFQDGVIKSLFIITWTTAMAWITWRLITKGRSPNNSIPGPILTYDDRIIIAYVLGASVLLYCTWDIWVLRCAFLVQGPRENWVGSVLWWFQNRLPASLALHCAGLASLISYWMTL